MLAPLLEVKNVTRTIHVRMNKLLVELNDWWLNREVFCESDLTSSYFLITVLHGEIPKVAVKLYHGNKVSESLLTDLGQLKVDQIFRCGKFVSSFNNNIALMISGHVCIIKLHVIVIDCIFVFLVVVGPAHFY